MTLLQALGLAVPEKKVWSISFLINTFTALEGSVLILFMYFHYESMADNDVHEAWSKWTRVAQLPEFISRSTIHCYTQTMNILGHAVSEKGICLCFPILSLWELMTAGGAIFDPRGKIRKIYVNLHILMTHTKYKSFGSCDFREEDLFHVFPIVSL